MKQFNFARNWRKRIYPLLNKPSVIEALTSGLIITNPSYKTGDPPWLSGRGLINGQRAKKSCLSWYQPWRRCHYIAPFSYAIGNELYPELNWGLVSSTSHTVVIGYKNLYSPELILDILLFKNRPAQESLDFVMKKRWRFYTCLKQYLENLSLHTPPKNCYNSNYVSTTMSDV